MLEFLGVCGLHMRGKVVVCEDDRRIIVVCGKDNCSVGIVVMCGEDNSSV